MITLANGSQTMAKGIGSACPLTYVPFTSVRYVPDCPFNLISISKLTRDLNCLITFLDNYVTLQDQSTGRTIGIGREFQASFISARLHLPLLALPWILLSLFIVVLVIRIFLSFR